ncbi:hypothetical protein C6P40_005482 [Pichia californica]|uniref:Transmembrane protein n=1 Tax=Pichia californica TaxID=460514 RepID=A0A9P7BEC1_9ASCO|nr:hypothetical protein C6P42_000715 [[Candida] californica]KAG0689147.1 hypothetical protein C6P40_005482 [[Candida] californica]
MTTLNANFETNETQFREPVIIENLPSEPPKYTNPPSFVSENDQPPSYEDEKLLKLIEAVYRAQRLHEERRRNLLHNEEQNYQSSNNNNNNKHSKKRWSWRKDFWKHCFAPAFIIISYTVVCFVFVIV